jgi:hypothetical protein
MNDHNPVRYFRHFAHDTSVTGSSIKLAVETDRTRTSPHRKRIFEFEGAIALVQVNQEICTLAMSAYNSAFRLQALRALSLSATRFLFAPAGS